MVATPPAPCRSLLGPPGPESRKSLQRLSGAFRPQGPKSVRNSLETVSGVSKQSILTLRRLFRTFWSPGPQDPRRLFGDSFGIEGPEGPGDSCKGRAGLQPYGAILRYYRCYTMFCEGGCNSLKKVRYPCLGAQFHTGPTLQNIA